MINKIKKFNNDLCCNNLLRIDPFLNYIQTTINDFINTNNMYNEDKKWNKKLTIEKLFLKFNQKYLCSDYFNDREALYIKLYELEDTKNKSLKSIKKLRIKSDKFLKRLKFEDNIKDKRKNEIINNTKFHLYFNGLGDFVINMNEYFWLYHYVDNVNSINNTIDFEQKFLFTYNKIIIKSNEIIRPQNIIFYDKIFIVWKPKSLKILYYELNTNYINVKINEKK